MDVIRDPSHSQVVTTGAYIVCEALPLAVDYTRVRCIGSCMAAPTQNRVVKFGIFELDRTGTFAGRAFN